MRSGLRWSGVGALIGVLAAAAALGIGEMVAAFVRPEASPVIAVGNRLIIATPESIKRWAIREFGTGDKDALLTGIYVFVALFAIGVGVLAIRHLLYGLVGIGVFAGIGCYCALSANASRGTDIVPTLVGAVVAGVIMVALLRMAAPRADQIGPPEPAESIGPLLGDRRRFLAGSVATAGLAAIAGFGGRATQHARFDVSEARAEIVLPTPTVSEAASAPLTGNDLGISGVRWDTPNSAFYRVDTALAVPQIQPNDWKLRIHGMVDHELTLTYEQLTALPLIERWITLCCVSNEVGGGLIGNAKFLGARLADVLKQVGVHPDADQLVLSSSDGMTIGTPTAVVMDGRDALIAIGMNGVPLPIEHGFPARIVVPGLYGYVSACKWVVDIEATTYGNQAAYWARGGWAARTDIKLESRIDTPHSGGTVVVGEPVPIAGIAWDQHVGVSTVEVQVDGGPWQDARLATVPSTDTWRQWVLMWTPPSAGSYVLRVRATDASGQVQTSATADPYPSGATGLHAITVRAR
ncbi:MAG: molybdopterin-dependent oxidoreductase [Jatrophihabitantaceae bacterium]